MKSKTKVATFSALILVICLVVLSFSYFPNADLKEKESNQITFSDSTSILLSFDEIVTLSTHILDAEYAGVSSTKYGSELMFKPISLIKGAIEDEIIYVPFTPSSPDEQIEYIINETYVLFLEKNSSVYYEHDKYVQLDEIHISSTSDEWKTVHERASTILSKSRSKANVLEGYGVAHTNSASMKDILDFSENIFEVQIMGIYAESTVTPTTVYNCNVVKTLKNVPDNNSILITMFNDTVKIGEKYVVLLADASETAPVYTLSSKNSVYPCVDAEKIPELTELCQNATAFKTSMTSMVTKTHEEILAEEQKFAIEQNK